jgi:hypothetical protein
MIMAEKNLEIASLELTSDVGIMVINKEAIRGENTKIYNMYESMIPINISKCGNK